MYDGDPAGIKASLRGIDLILEEGMNVRVILLPQPEDPDSFARSHSSSELNSYLHDNETDFIHFKTNLLLGEVNNDPILKAQAIGDIVKSIAIVPDAITRSLFIKECSKLLQVDENVLLTEVNKQRRTDFEKKSGRENTAVLSVQVNNTVATPVEINELEIVEKEIVRIMLMHGTLPLFPLHNDENEIIREISVQEYFINEIQHDELEFSNNVYKQIFDEYQHFVNNGQLLENKYFIQHPHEEISKAVTDILSESTRYELSKRYRKKEVFIETEDMKLKTDVPRIVLKYKMKRVELMIKEIKTQILEAQNQNKLPELIEMQNKLQTFNTIRVHLSKELGIVA